MKTSNCKGVQRNLDNLARVVIPAEFRRHMKLDPNSPVEIYLTGEGILITKPDDSCVFCGLTADKEIEGRYICKECRKKLRARLAKKVADNEK